MTNKIKLSVTKREILGKKVKKLRQEGTIVANIFGLGESISIQAPLREAAKLYEKVGESTVVYLSVDDGKDLPVLFDQVQLDPFHGNLLHVSFRAVNLKEKLRTLVTISTTGELAAKGAVALLQHQEVEVEALPTNLPEGFIIDLSTLENIGDEVKFSNLDYDKTKVELLVENLDAPVLVVNEHVEQAEESIEEQVEEGSEGAVIEEAEKEVTETPAQ